MLTIILMSKNNSKYLHRCLTFYKEIGFEGELLIADASEQEIQKDVASQVKLFQNQRFNPKLYTYPSTFRYGEKAADIVSKVSTPYVLVAPLDDFFSMETLRQGITFLEKHQDYTFTYGYSFGFIYSEGKSEWLYTGDCYNSRSFNEKEPLDRIKAFFQKGFTSLCHALFRTKDLKIITQKTGVYANDPWVKYNENLLILLTLLRGKGHYVSLPYSWREINIKSDTFRYGLTWAHNEESPLYWSMMQEALTEVLQEWNNLDYKDASDNAVLITEQFKLLYDNSSLTNDKINVGVLKKMAQLLLPQSLKKILVQSHVAVKFLAVDIKRELTTKRYLLDKQGSVYSKEFALIKYLVEASAIATECPGIEHFRMRRPL